MTLCDRVSALPNKMVRSVGFFVFIAAFMGISNSNAAEGGDMDYSKLLQILKTHDQFNEKTLPQLPAWPEEMVVSGDLRQWQTVVYKGEQIVGAIWLSKPGKLQIDGYPFDQMVLVLDGSVTLQPDGEQEQTYYKGDIFFVPKGYKGSWEMPGDYKEFITVEKNAWIEVEGE